MRMRHADFYASDIHIAGRPDTEGAKKITRDATDALKVFLDAEDIYVDTFGAIGDNVELVVDEKFVPGTLAGVRAHTEASVKEQFLALIYAVGPERIEAYIGNHETRHVLGEITPESARAEDEIAYSRTYDFLHEITPSSISFEVHTGFGSHRDGVICHHGHHLDIPDVMRSTLSRLASEPDFEEMSTEDKLDYINGDTEIPVALQELWAKYITYLGYIIKHAGLDTYTYLENFLAMIVIFTSLIREYREGDSERELLERVKNSRTSHVKLQEDLLNTFDADLIISGHSHLPGIVQNEATGQTVVSLGAWVNGATNPVCGIHMKKANEFWMIEYKPQIGPKGTWVVRDKKLLI
jgi:UDP-2,3-diacylglucosamine pyrophosphatase LpxH